MVFALHIETEGYVDCVEVTGSHVGLIFNRMTYRAIAAALAAAELWSGGSDAERP